MPRSLAANSLFLGVRVPVARAPESHNMVMVSKFHYYLMGVCHPKQQNLHFAAPPRSGDSGLTLGRMQDYELDYDVQEVRLSDYVFKVTTVANEALPLEMLMQLQERRSANCHMSAVSNIT